MKNKQEIENELAYSWKSEPKTISSLESTKGWLSTAKKYHVIDSIYDSEDNYLASNSTGVRVRTQDTKTILTAKRYMGEGQSGESIFKENSKSLPSSIHPDTLPAEGLNLGLKQKTLNKQLHFLNNRHEFLLSKDDMSILLVNEEVTYADSFRIYTEYILEVEFKNISSGLVNKVRNELESKFNLELFKEGKTDRAKRFLEIEKHNPLIESMSQVKPIQMSAHGGKGLMEMRFFHQPYNHFYSEAVNNKILGYENSNWDFFGYACLPIGAEIKQHLHDKTDEIYFITNGSATINIDGQERIINKGDCILTRKGSEHGVYNVTENLEFIAIEIR